MFDIDLIGKVVVVIGGSWGIGCGIVECFLWVGVFVVINGCN